MPDKKYLHQLTLEIEKHINASFRLKCPEEVIDVVLETLSFCQERFFLSLPPFGEDIPCVSCGTICNSLLSNPTHIPVPVFELGVAKVYCSPCVNKALHLVKKEQPNE